MQRMKKVLRKREMETKNWSLMDLVKLLSSGQQNRLRYKIFLTSYYLKC